MIDFHPPLDAAAERENELLIAACFEAESVMFAHDGLASDDWRALLLSAGHAMDMAEQIWDPPRIRLPLSHTEHPEVDGLVLELEPLDRGLVRLTVCDPARPYTFHTLTPAELRELAGLCRYFADQAER